MLTRAVNAGHETTALIHHNTDIDAPGVTVLVGDATDEHALDAAVTGRDAVICTVGGRTPYQRTTLEADVARALVTTMHCRGVRRLIGTSSLGVGDSTRNAPLPARLVVATFLRGSTRDKTAREAVFRSSGLDWVVVRPAVLSSTAPTGAAHVVTAASRTKAHGVTRADLATFLVDQLSTDAHLSTTPTLTDG